VALEGAKLQNIAAVVIGGTNLFGGEGGRLFLENSFGRIIQAESQQHGVGFEKL